MAVKVYLGRETRRVFQGGCSPQARLARFLMCMPEPWIALLSSSPQARPLAMPPGLAGGLVQTWD